MIELYIENNKVDLKDDVDISFVLETIDPDKLSSVKNSFSKTVTLPGTNTNNHILGHIFRNDRYIPDLPGTPINSLYDPHKKINYFITENGNFINRGYCTLDDIIIKNTYEIEYKLTLYGGIGEFFYSLSYDEQGNKKTLFDIYYKWRGRHENSYDASALTAEQEEYSELYYCSIKNITQAYHNLDPYYGYSDATLVDRDIVFVPCYTGMYEDFDSKHMLVCDWNWKNTSTTNNYYILANNISTLQSSFPSHKTYDSSDYYTFGENFSSGATYTFGLATFSRDVDPYEAGDLRTNELPVAIRLSKLLYRISQPENNGGYTVQWDSDILNSFYWRYGWVMLKKLKQQEASSNTTLQCTPSTTTPNQTINMFMFNDNEVDDYAIVNGTSNVNISVSNWTQNAGTLKFNQAITFNLSSNTSDTASVANKECWSAWCYHTWTNTPGPQGHIVISTEDFRVNYYCRLSNVYDGNTLKHSYLDVFFFKDKNNTTAYVGPVLGWPKTTDFINKINLTYSVNLTADDVNIHYLDLKYNTTNSNTIVFKTMQDNIQFDIDKGISNLSIRQTQFFAWVKYYQRLVESHIMEEYTNFYIYGVDYAPGMKPYFSTMSNTSVWEPIEEPDDGFWTNTTQFNVTLTGTWISGDVIVGYEPISLTKHMLFDDTDSPMKYFTDFCKMLNLSFECDNTTKKIYIYTKKNYYNGLTFDLDDRIDHSREIKIKPILTNAKSIMLGLETPETYPVKVFNRGSKLPFNSTRIETGIEYNVNEEKLLDNLIYKNTIDWQQNSIFYNIRPQIPKPYDAISISWTLWSVNKNTAREFITGGISPLDPTSTSTYDFMPKNALFNSENKMEDAFPSFIFLNGFIQNYDYIYSAPSSGGGRPAYKTIYPRITFSNDCIEQITLNGKRCYMNAVTYGTATTYNSYGLYNNYTAASFILPFFTRDLYNVYDPEISRWKYAGGIAASWNIYNQAGLPNLYKFTSNTSFIKNPAYSYSVRLNNNSSTNNEYTISTKPDDLNEASRIYDGLWKYWISEAYDKNSREAICYIDLTGLGDLNSLMRNFYYWNGSLWVITKIDGYRLNNFGKDKFTKVTLKRVVNQDAYLVGLTTVNSGGGNSGGGSTPVDRE